MSGNQADGINKPHRAPHTHMHTQIRNTGRCAEKR